MHCVWFYKSKHCEKMLRPLSRLFYKLSRWHRHTKNSSQTFRPFCYSNQTSSANINLIEEQKVLLTEPTLSAIFDSIPPESDALSPIDALCIFRQFNTKYGKASTVLTAANVLNHPNFPILRNAMKSSLPYLKMDEIKEVLLTIYLLRISKDELTDAVIESLIEHTNIMSIRQITQFNSMLKSKKNSCLQANKLSARFQECLVKRFNTEISHSPMKFNYFYKTRHILRFIGTNLHQISDETFRNIAVCAQVEAIDIITVQEAIEVIISISKLGLAAEYFEPLLQKAFNIFLAESNVTIGMVITVLRYCSNFKTNEIYRLLADNQRFTEKCVQVAIDTGDEQEMFKVLRGLNVLELSSILLIDILSNHLANKFSTKDFFQDSITFCTACDIAAYKPKDFDTKLAPAINSLDFREQIRKKSINWPMFAIRLYRLKLKYRSLVDAILKEKELFSNSSIVQLEQMEFNDQ